MSDASPVPLYFAPSTPSPALSSSRNAEEIARLLEPQPGDSPPQPPQAAGWSAAFWACTHRALRSYYRQPSYNFVSPGPLYLIRAVLLLITEA